MVVMGESSGAAVGAVRVWLRLEGLAVLGAATWMYAAAGGGPWWFAAWFLVPDLSMLGYLAGPRPGAASYNLAHSYVGPVVLGVAAAAEPVGVQLALIWAAHIGFDRLLGYGLKYPRAFGDTHLGPIGRAASLR